MSSYELGDIAARGIGHDEIHRLFEGSSGAEDSGDALLFQAFDVLLRDGAAYDDENVVRTLGLEQRHHAGHDGIVGAAQDGEANDLDVFLDGGVDDHLRSLSQAGVDDLHAGVAQATRNHFGSAVVAIEAGLGDQYADWSLERHRRVVNIFVAATDEYNWPCLGMATRERPRSS
jgi:hypothetical protein